MSHIIETVVWSSHFILRRQRNFHSKWKFFVTKRIRDFSCAQTLRDIPVGNRHSTRGKIPTEQRWVRDNERNRLENFLSSFRWNPATKQVRWFKIEMITMPDVPIVTQKNYSITFLLFIRDKCTIWILIYWKKCFFIFDLIYVAHPQLRNNYHRHLLSLYIILLFENCHLWRGESNKGENSFFFPSHIESFGFRDIFFYNLKLLSIIQFTKFSLHAW